MMIISMMMIVVVVTRKEFATSRSVRDLLPTFRLTIHLSFT